MRRTSSYASDLLCNDISCGGTGQFVRPPDRTYGKHDDFRANVLVPFYRSACTHVERPSFLIAVALLSDTVRNSRLKNMTPFAQRLEVAFIRGVTSPPQRCDVINFIRLIKQMLANRASPTLIRRDPFFDEGRYIRAFPRRRPPALDATPRRRLRLHRRFPFWLRLEKKLTVFKKTKRCFRINP